MMHICDLTFLFLNQHMTFHQTTNISVYYIKITHCVQMENMENKILGKMFIKNYVIYINPLSWQLFCINKLICKQINTMLTFGIVMVC